MVPIPSSSWTCQPHCNAGFELHGQSRCSGGVLSIATCERIDICRMLSKVNVSVSDASAASDWTFRVRLELDASLPLTDLQPSLLILPQDSGERLELTASPNAKEFFKASGDLHAAMGSSLQSCLSMASTARLGRPRCPWNAGLNMSGTEGVADGHRSLPCAPNQTFLNGLTGFLLANLRVCF